MNSVYFSEEHEAFRTQLRRFVQTEIQPNADAWEKAGEIPRDVFRRMGELGFLGVRYPEEYGGAGMDTFGSVVLAEELGRSGLGGFTASTTVHTDMASPHLERYGSHQPETLLVGMAKPIVPSLSKDIQHCCQQSCNASLKLQDRVDSILFSIFVFLYRIVCLI